MTIVMDTRDRSLRPPGIMRDGGAQGVCQHLDKENTLGEDNPGTVEAPRQTDELVQV